MASKYWIKLYHEILHDPKMGRLSDRLWRRFVELCLLAGENDADGVLPTVGDMAWILRLEKEELQADLDELANLGFVGLIDDHISYSVTNFSKRQAPVSGAERIARYRDRKRQEQYNGNESLQDDETNRYTDTDTDTDVEIPAPATPEAGATASPPPHKKARSRASPDNGKNQPEHRAVFAALLGVYRLDAKLLTNPQRARFNALSKKIREAGYGAGDITAAGTHWYQNDWRGQKGQPPANDGQFMEALSAVKVKPQKRTRLKQVEACPET